MTEGEGGRIPEASAGAVDLAYAIAVDAYGSAREQWEGVHRRLDALLSFITTVTIAVPVASEAVLEDPGFNSPLLISSGAIYLVTVLTALIARSFGAIQQISPRELHERWLNLDGREFREGIIDWSGQHNAHAQVLITRKNLAANVMAALFVGEALTLITWIVTAG